MSAEAAKLCLIAGGGALPLEAAAHIRASGRSYVVVRIEGVSDPELQTHPGISVGLGHFAQMFAFMEEQGVRSVCMAGYVQRPDFNTLNRDEGGEQHLPSIANAARGGDDGLLRQVASMFAQRGLTIEGVHQAAPEMLLGEGLQAGPEPSEPNRSDIERALHIAKIIGAEDIGQAVVVANGVTLAIEAQEGTQPMLRRLLTLNPALLGSAKDRSGVLVKLPKPVQDLRLDMPVIGIETVEDVAKAGLAGIAGRAGNLLVVNKSAVYARASELGIFIQGVAHA